ncbi:uncharacterized protein LOC131418962 isoform X4 [Diceros bicornis minor]|uniref:uncharacterized protein LOC131418962 isoform X4 n=1 Tax=Diceros bicornis minor TaxID=77932 RepID=UPI0026EB31C0|nr:uncharacterized protein LOC131418962 isoform X4 [Diceros bicornis minor]
MCVAEDSHGPGGKTGCSSSGGALHVCSPREQPPESAGEAAAAAGIPSHEGDPAAPGGCKELQARARGSDLGPRSRTWSCSMRMRATPCPASQSARPSWPAEYARPRRTGHHQGQGSSCRAPASSRSRAVGSGGGRAVSSSVDITPSSAGASIRSISSIGAGARAHFGSSRSGSC